MMSADLNRHNWETVIHSPWQAIWCMVKPETALQSAVIVQHRTVFTVKTLMRSKQCQQKSVTQGFDCLICAHEPLPKLLDSSWPTFPGEVNATRFQSLPRVRQAERTACSQTTQGWRVGRERRQFPGMILTWFWWEPKPCCPFSLCQKNTLQSWQQQPLFLLLTVGIVCFCRAAGLTLSCPD